MPTVAPYEFDEYVECAAFLGDTAAFALADGTVRLIAGGETSVAVHDGGLLCGVVDGDTMLTGGEDGKVMRISADGSATQVADIGRKWIDKIATGPNGAVGFATGRTAHVALADGTVKEFAHERTVEDLAFAPKGLRLATARYNGASLHWVSTAGAPVTLEWKGAHTGVSFSPDGRFLVTTMQENALHGWRLDNKVTGEGKHMRMSGYPAKVKCMSWSPKNKWLATSGAPAAICWPFSSKDGPMGKAPKELGTRGDALVTQVACHPQEQVVAIGYNDGMIMLARIEDGKEVLMRRPSDRASDQAISTLAWDGSGNRVAFGSEGGEAGTIDITG